LNTSIQEVFEGYYIPACEQLQELFEPCYHKTPFVLKAGTPNYQG